MSSRTVLRASIAALCGVSASFATGSAWAQEPDKDAAGEEMGVITVTGSRTITDVLKSPTPITSVDIGELALTTPSDTADALNKLPSIIGGRTPRNQGNGSTNNGGNTLSLRNFGPSRTLVLLDGHRVAPSNQDGSVNIDVLPQMLVKTVDINTGGASAIYGSDAVAGVVNLILRRDFRGVEASVRGGSGDAYNERLGSLIAGTGWDGGNLMAAYEYSFHSNLSGLDRDFFRGDLSTRGGRDFRVVQCNPGNIVVNNVSHAIPAGGVTTATAAQLVPNTTNRCDNAQFQDLIP